MKKVNSLEEFGRLCEEGDYVFFIGGRPIAAMQLMQMTILQIHFAIQSQNLFYSKV